MKPSVNEFFLHKRARPTPRPSSCGASAQRHHCIKTRAQGFRGNSAQSREGTSRAAPREIRFRPRNRARACALLFEMNRDGPSTRPCGTPSSTSCRNSCPCGATNRASIRFFFFFLRPYFFPILPSRAPHLPFTDVTPLRTDARSTNARGCDYSIESDIT